MRLGALSRLGDEQEHSQGHAVTNKPASQTNKDEQMPLPEAEVDLGDPSAFFRMASTGHAKEMSAMLRAGLSANIENEARRTALHLAAAAGNLDVVNLLLEHGAIANTRDSDG